MLAPGQSARVDITAPMAGDDDPSLTLSLRTAPGMSTGARIPLATARRLLSQLQLALDEVDVAQRTSGYETWLAALPVNPE